MHSASPHQSGDRSGQASQVSQFSRHRTSGKADLSHPAIRIVMGLVLAVLLLGGITRLLMKRYEKGDVYPPYSSLRLDPLGTAAFHDALTKQPGVSVRRNSEPLEDLERMSGMGTPGGYTSPTILLLGIDPAWVLDPEGMATVKRLAAQGHRVVVALRPARGTRLSWSDPEEEKADDFKIKNPDGDAEDAAPVLELKFLDADETDKDGEKKKYFASHSLAGVEDDLPWFSRVAFKNLDSEWATVLTLDGDPVGIVLRQGVGSVLLLGDSYLFSNEALLKDKRPGFLRWCVDGADQIVFDETHLGLFRQDNVMTLLRRYHLVPAVGVCLLAALFFLWRNALPFPPRTRTRAPELSIVGGLDAGSGLLNLLRRSIPPSELLATCLAEWRSSLPREAAVLRPAQRSALARLESETDLPPSARNPASAYNEATRILEKTL